MSETSIEMPDDDAAEQAREVPEEEAGKLRELPLEVDEADAAEQYLEVSDDEDTYR